MHPVQERGDAGPEEDRTTHRQSDGSHGIESMRRKHLSDDRWPDQQSPFSKCHEDTAATAAALADRS